MGNASLLYISLNSMTSQKFDIGNNHIITNLLACYFNHLVYCTHRLNNNICIKFVGVLSLVRPPKKEHTRPGSPTVEYVSSSSHGREFLVISKLELILDMSDKPVDHLLL